MKKMKKTQRDYAMPGEFKLFYVKFIALAYGCWGSGETPKEALKNLVKEGGKEARKKHILYLAVSDKPFMEGSKLASEDDPTKADFFVSGSGAVCSWHCEYRVIDWIGVPQP